MRVVRGALKMILLRNRRLKSQNVTSGPSLIIYFHYRKFCDVSESSCAACDLLEEGCRMRVNCQGGAKFDALKK